MRKYAMLVLFECAQRALTRVVVEIAYDFIKRNAETVLIDETLKIEAVEFALLHLNDVDMSVCEDLLFLVVPNGSLLCEAFMQVMTSTQNFSRFKSVFLSLTYFMVNNDRTFTLEVAVQVLERVCILPFEEPVVRALVQIIRLTDPEVFLNSMISHFEKVISVNSDVLNEYMLIKREVDFEKLARRVKESQTVQIQQPTLQQPAIQHQPAMLNVDPVQTVRPEMREGVPLPPSPDTTHLDHVNKPNEETMVPQITRTIRGLNLPPTPIANPITPTNKMYQGWKNKSIFQHINRSKYPSPMRPPPARMMRPQMQKGFNQRLVTFGGSPIIYPPPGPDN